MPGISCQARQGHAAPCHAAVAVAGYGMLPALPLSLPLPLPLAVRLGKPGPPP